MYVTCASSCFSVTQPAEGTSLLKCPFETFNKYRKEKEDIMKDEKKHHSKLYAITFVYLEPYS